MWIKYEFYTIIYLTKNNNRNIKNDNDEVDWRREKLTEIYLYPFR